jgi:hypothetical protein
MTTDIRTKASTDAYREGYDRIFGKPDEEHAATTFSPYDGLKLFARSNQPACDCAECNPQGDGFYIPMRMIVCGRCGNKRCPGAASHRNACTGSNDA